MMSPRDEENALLLRLKARPDKLAEDAAECIRSMQRSIDEAHAETSRLGCIEAAVELMIADAFHFTREEFGRYLAKVP